MTKCNFCGLQAHSCRCDIGEYPIAPATTLVPTKAPSAPSPICMDEAAPAPAESEKTTQGTRVLTRVQRVCNRGWEWWERFKALFESATWWRAAMNLVFEALRKIRDAE